MDVFRGLCSISPLFIWNIRPAVLVFFVAQKRKSGISGKPCRMRDAVPSIGNALFGLELVKPCQMAVSNAVQMRREQCAVYRGVHIAHKL